jgi:hypothetical protein
MFRDTKKNSIIIILLDNTPFNVAGLFGLGGLVGATAQSKYKNSSAPKRLTVPAWI